MSPWAKRQAWRSLALALAVGLFAVAGVWVVNAETPTPMAPDVAEPAILEDTVGETASNAATASPDPSSTPRKPAAQPVNLIENGGFEDGFFEGIGVGWERFAAGNVQAGWQDDTWDEVVYEGEHSQLLSLKDAWETDRYVGIFQVIRVAPDTEYLLTLHGLVRSDEGSVAESDYGYRLQYGLDFEGGRDWQSPKVAWVELPWDDQPRTGPPTEGYRRETYTATITAQTAKVTLFIRGWKKWPGDLEGNYNVDGLSLAKSRLVSVPQPTDTPAAVMPTPVPTAALVVSTPASQATETPVMTSTAAAGMPQTGSSPLSINDNLLVMTSVLFLAVLIGGVIWNLSRRRT
jgi:hypothetical protein